MLIVQGHTKNPRVDPTQTRDMLDEYVEGGAEVRMLFVAFL